MTTIVQSAMTAAVPVPDLSSVETQLAVQNLRSVINNNSAYIRAVDGIADEFADETGVKLDSIAGQIAHGFGTKIGTFGSVDRGQNGDNDEIVGGLNASTQLTSANIGKYFSNGEYIEKVIVYDPNNAGFTNGGNAVTLTLQCSTDTTDGTNGTWVDYGSVTATMVAGRTPKTITSSAQTTLFKGVRVNLTRTDGTWSYITELEMFAAAVSFGTVNTTYNATSDYYTTEEVEVIPTMTSNTAPYGTMSAHAVDSGLASYAADLNLGSVWTTPSGNQLGWIAYEATTPSVVTKYKIINGGNAARGLVAWTFEGYNGSGWDVLDTQSGQPTDTLQTVRYYTFVNTTAYAKHRINVSANGGNSYTQVAEIQFYFGGGDMTLMSDTFTAETAPTEASAVFLHQPIVAVTLNTDILGYISRDAGTTWTLGTLVDAGSFDSTTNILTMNAVDISAQPSGTSMKYKIVTANAKEQRLHGAWLAWS